MTKQRNKFLTFLFSLAPGCGQMFMGFMKRGLSLLSLFVLSIVAASVFNFMELGAISFLIWCWAFFDSINLMSLTPEKFATVEDDFVICGKNSDFPKVKIPSNKLARVSGIALILLAVYSIWNMVFDTLYSAFYYDNPQFAELVWQFNRYVPRIALSVVLIVVGVKLIGRKKTETQNDEALIDEQIEK